MTHQRLADTKFDELSDVLKHFAIFAHSLLRTKRSWRRKTKSQITPARHHR